MANKKYEQKYTKPDLREEIKEDIQQSDKGGRPGQWSARKSQLLVQEYEKQGGGYQHVGWTPAIKRAMREAGYSEGSDRGSESSESSSNLEDQSKVSLYDRARELQISGRSKMSKQELIENIQKAEN